jgi:large subunit ribosomal protein L29
MKSREIREMSDTDILNALEDKREALFNLRFQKAVGQLEDVTAPRRAQREVARLMTELHARELAKALTQEGGNG